MPAAISMRYSLYCLVLEEHAVGTVKAKHQIKVPIGDRIVSSLLAPAKPFYGKQTEKVMQKPGVLNNAVHEMTCVKLRGFSMHAKECFWANI